ncbi:hypothetical protein MMC25_003079 [Agyrium rufum]|nr:hypothetical protein [Agyrium rufum]
MSQPSQLEVTALVEEPLTGEIVVDGVAGVGVLGNVVLDDDDAVMPVKSVPIPEAEFDESVLMADTDVDATRDVDNVPTTEIKVEDVAAEERGKLVATATDEDEGDTFWDRLEDELGIGEELPDIDSPVTSDDPEVVDVLVMDDPVVDEATEIKLLAAGEELAVKETGVTGVEKLAAAEMVSVALVRELVPCEMLAFGIDDIVVAGIEVLVTEKMVPEDEDAIGAGLPAREELRINDVAAISDEEVAKEKLPACDELDDGNSVVTADDDVDKKEPLACDKLETGDVVGAAEDAVGAELAAGKELTVGTVLAATEELVPNAELVPTAVAEDVEDLAIAEELDGKDDVDVVLAAEEGLVIILEPITTGGPEDVKADEAADEALAERADTAVDVVIAVDETIAAELGLVDPTENELGKAAMLDRSELLVPAADVCDGDVRVTGVVGKAVFPLDWDLELVIGSARVEAVFVLIEPLLVIAEGSCVVVGIAEGAALVLAATELPEVEVKLLEVEVELLEVEVELLEGTPVAKTGEDEIAAWLELSGGTVAGLDTGRTEVDDVRTELDVTAAEVSITAANVADEVSTVIEDELGDALSDATATLETVLVDNPGPVEDDEATEFDDEAEELEIAEVAIVVDVPEARNVLFDAEEGEALIEPVEEVELRAAGEDREATEDDDTEVTVAAAVVTKITELCDVAGDVLEVFDDGVAELAVRDKAD